MPGGTGNTAAAVICRANMVLAAVTEQQPVLPQQPAPAAALTAAHGALVHIEAVLPEIVGHREQVVAQAGAQPLEEGRPVGQGSRQRRRSEGGRVAAGAGGASAGGGREQLGLQGAIGRDCGLRRSGLSCFCPQAQEAGVSFWRAAV